MFLFLLFVVVTRRARQGCWTAGLLAMDRMTERVRVRMQTVPQMSVEQNTLNTLPETSLWPACWSLTCCCLPCALQRLLPHVMRLAMPKAKKNNLPARMAQAARQQPRQHTTSKQMMHPKPVASRKKGVLKQWEAQLKQQVNSVVVAQQEQQQQQQPPRQQQQSLQSAEQVRHLPGQQP